MPKSWIELVVGSLEEKRVYRRAMRRVNALPKDYRFAYKKILNYGYQFGFCCLTQSDLLELFEEGAAARRPVGELVGRDAAAFCDELILALAVRQDGARERLNREIAEHFNREGG